jgi:prevent-host-death family protein
MWLKHHSLPWLARRAKVAGVKVVNMHEAKTTLSQIIEQVERGEEIVIARAGVPVARLVAIRAGAQRRLGQWRGRVRMAPDFDAQLSPEDQRAWEGDE